MMKKLKKEQSQVPMLMFIRMKKLVSLNLTLI